MLKRSEPQSLEQYLSQIAHELRALPPQARVEELREIEAHLRAMIEARGDVAGVLAQFGEPRRIGRKLRKAWQRKQPEAWWRAGLAPLAGLMFFALDTLLYTRFCDWVNDSFGDILLRPWSAAIYFCFALWMMATFFFTGFTAGIVSPKRGIWLTLFYCVYSGYVLLMLPSALEHAKVPGQNVMSVTLIFLLVNLICPVAALAGTYISARRGKKVSARIESGGRKIFAHITTGRKVLARITGDSKLNVQL